MNSESQIPQAISCERIGKEFALKESFSAWNVLLKGESRGEGYCALSDISLKVPKGKITAVLGRNGAGKSTLLRVLGGVYQPTHGSCAVLGKASALYEFGLWAKPTLTGREYAKRILKLKEVPEAELAEVLSDIHSFSELGEYFDRPIYTYSAGMGSRLYFSVLTAEKYDVYLIDEALAVGDEYFQRKCWARLRGLLRGGASGILVTHDWSAALRLCDYAYVLDSGKIVKAGDVEQVVREYLSLPLPELSEEGRFLNLPQSVRAASGEDFRLLAKIECRGGSPLELGMSVEVLRKGYGWEILFMRDGDQIVDSDGIYECEIVVPKLPLYAGEYTLNLFLNGRRSDGTRVSMDVRSWTYGNAIRLEVTGVESSAGCRLPIRVSDGRGL